MLRITILVCLMFGQVSVFAGKIPAANQNNVWFRGDSRDTTIIFIHGLLSDSRSCWANGHGTYWPTLLEQDRRFDSIDIYLAGYATEIDTGEAGIRQAADQVLSALQRTDVDGRRVMSANKLIFVAHSLGGVVLRYMLENNVPAFQDKAVGIVLIASPSFGSKWADLLSWFVKLYRNEFGKELTWGSSLLADLDARFKKMVDRRQIPQLFGVEGYESRFVVRSRWLPKLIPGDIRIVTAESAGRYFGDAKYLPDTDHFTAVKPTSFDHPGYTLVLDFLQQKFVPAISNGAVKKRNSGALLKAIEITLSSGQAKFKSTVAHLEILRGAGDVIGTARLIDVPLGAKSTKLFDLQPSDAVYKSDEKYRLRVAIEPTRDDEWDVTPSVLLTWTEGPPTRIQFGTGRVSESTPQIILEAMP